MNIKQALKRKNKLASKLKQALAIMSTSNSIVVGANAAYSSQAKLKEATDTAMELVALKAKIHAANVPVAGLIFEASELKGMIQALRNMSCNSGAVYGYRSETPIQYTAEISELRRDELVADLEARLDEINEQLDQFNAITQIGE